MKKEFTYLKKFSLFESLNEKEVQSFIDLMKFKRVKKEEVIIQEGEQGDSIILLLSGEVSITQALTLKNEKLNTDNREKMLIRLKAEQFPYFGEISLFNEVDKRTATITAISDCEIAILNDNKLIDLCENNHSLGYKIMKNLAGNLAASLEKTNHQVLKLTTVFSLILDN